METAHAKPVPVVKRIQAGAAGLAAALALSWGLVAAFTLLLACAVWLGTLALEAR